MESVMQKIRESREDKYKKQDNLFDKDTSIDGCQVKIRFDEVGDNKVMSAIRSMLMSAHLDAALATPAGGE
ncbi:MAG: hypothetical protein FWG28_01115 [Clostridiales bacterium]|nr:hypothetical protein [Clostridiales bacterium]